MAIYQFTYSHPENLHLATAFLLYPATEAYHVR
ncbi:hypothetical protein PEC730217_32760 [Pectobacterium carotovorum subsp. carotovorum]|nr:hypothetical protein PEC730217_32760 [Pectobacterium carotovorum subsp. carotovorum]